MYACAVKDASITTCGLYCAEYFGMRTSTMYMSGAAGESRTIHTYKQFVHDTPVYVKLTQARPNYLQRLEGHTATMHSVCVREDICSG